MARFLGPAGHRLRRISFRMLLISGVCLLALGFMLLFVLSDWLITRDTMRFMVASLFVVPFVVFFWYMYKKADRESKSYIIGSHGENNIQEELQCHLSDEYACFHHVVVGRAKGDIDFVVVGPTGVYVIEVKNYSGTISLRNGELMRNGWLLQKNIFRQVGIQADGLERFLREKFKTKIFVRRVIVFVGQAEAPFKLEPVDGVYVIHEGWLQDLIESTLPVYSFPVDRKEIEKQLEMAVIDYYK